MSIVSGYAGLIVDLDGVVFLGNEPIRDAITFLKRLRRSGTEVVYATNNSARSSDDWSTAFATAKLEVRPQQIITSADATAALLAGDPPPRCFVLGERGLLAVLRAAGVGIVADADEADTVVVGLDRAVTWQRLADAASAIRRGARFVATNPDRSMPTPDGPVPGNGAAIAFLRAATGVAPEIVGKPQPALYALAAQRLGVDGPILVVGDRIETDLAAAARMGLDGALVLTGSAGWPSIIDADVPPRWVVQHLGDLDGPKPPWVRPAREADLSAIRGLLAGPGFDVEGAAARLPNTLVAETGEAVVGTISWERFENAAHLRGITVAEKERRHGTGSHLIVRGLHQLKREGTDWVYLLTPGANEVFERLGFWRVHRDRVPEAVLASAQFGPPASGGVAFVRRLR